MKKLLYSLVLCALATSLYSQLPQLSLTQMASGFTKPIDIKHCGDDRIFVVTQPGIIYIMDKAGNVSPTPFLDIHSEVLLGSEQGLLSMAFSPNYKHDGFFYVNYIFGTGSGSTRIARFQVNALDSNTANAGSEKVLLTFTQPYTNHKGATLLFGNDGYLYDTQGDGGSGGDPTGNGQNTNAYLGKILRLDVSNPDTTYTIPPTNPFAGQTGVKQEIWAYGLRNPFRCSFDRLTHDLWIGDVGQDLYEEVDFHPAADTGGQDYGWRCYEGFHTYNATGCAATGFTFPVFEYVHTGNGCAVIGGRVYRGAEFSKLWGLYLFTDECSGKFWSLKQTSPGVFDPDTLQTFSTGDYSCIGEDNNGELYVSGVNSGKIFRLTETSNCNPVAYILPHDSIACGPVTLSAVQGDTLIYQWYNSDGPISLAGSSQFAATTPGWYRVRVSKAQIGCQTISDSVYVQPFDTATLTISNNTITRCKNAGVLDLSSNVSPAGGLFSGLGITGTTFDPAVAGVGPHTIQYNYENTSHCNTSVSFVINVSDTIAPVIPTPDTIVCQGGPPIDLYAFVTNKGGIFSGTGVTNDSLLDVSLTGNSTIYYQVINTPGFVGCTSIENFIVSIQICEGIDELTNVISAEIYPNPNNGQFELRAFAQQKQKVEIEVMDVVGQTCYRSQNELMPQGSVIPINLTALAKGMYILQMKCNSGEMYSRKFLVN